MPILFKPDGNGFNSIEGSDEWNNLKAAGFTLTEEEYHALTDENLQADLERAKANQAAAAQATKDAQKAIADANQAALESENARLAAEAQAETDRIAAEDAAKAAAEAAPETPSEV